MEQTPTELQDLTPFANYLNALSPNVFRYLTAVLNVLSPNVFRYLTAVYPFIICMTIKYNYCNIKHTKDKEYFILINVYL